MKKFLEGCEILAVNLKSVVDQFANDHHCTDTVIIVQLMESVKGPWLVRCYVNNDLYLSVYPSFTDDHNSIKYQVAQLFYKFVLTILE